MLFTDGPLDQLDHSATLPCFGGKIGIDATAKGPDEGTREWPPEIEMSPEVRARVDARWAELGLPGVDVHTRRGTCRMAPGPVASGPRVETVRR